MHFNKPKILPGESDIEIELVCIKSSEQVKFLGVIFDYQMSFTPHLNCVQRRCYKTSNIIKFLCGTCWESGPDTLTTLYKSYSRSIIDYACFVWFPKLKKAVEKNKENSVCCTVKGNRISNNYTNRHYYGLVKAVLIG